MPRLRELRSSLTAPAAQLCDMRVLAYAALAASASAFYLPGVAVHEYAQDERVEIKVNKLTSTKTQLVRGSPFFSRCRQMLRRLPCR